MNARRRSHRLVLVAGAGLFALVWTGVLAQFHLSGRATFLDRIEAPLLDLRFALAGPRLAPAGLVIVAIDDATVREAGRFPLPRSALADLVRRLTALGARVVALDLLLIDGGNAEEDRALAGALGEARAVIAAAGIFRNEPWGTAEGAGIPAVERVIWPVRDFGDQAVQGLVNIATDHAGTPRHVPLLLRDEREVIPSFVLGVAARMLDAEARVGTDRIALGPVVTRTDLGLNLPLRFYGPRGAIQTVSARAVLRDEVERGAIAGRAVVIGATALGTGDTFATPFDPVLPGVEVLATAAGHLMAGDGLVRDTAVRRIDAAAGVLLSAGAVLLIGSLPLGAALTLVGLAAAAWLGATAIAFGSGLWLSAVIPLAGLAVPAALCATLRYTVDGMHLRRLARAEQALRLFQSPVLAERIENDPSYLAQPQQQDVPIVFIDLTNFTSLSEQLGPARTRTLLAEFHAIVEREVTSRGGLVLNFMGDGAMIAFGIPDAFGDDAARAVDTALSLIGSVRDWLSGTAARLAAPPLRDLDVKVGGHHGPVVLSRLGTDTHQHITITGDSVNVASRLMEVAAQRNACIALSADLLRAAGDAAASLPPGGLQTVSIRGREQVLQVALWPAEREAQAARSQA